MHYAAENERVEVIRFLAKRFGAWHYVDRAGRTPMDLAIEKKPDEIIKILLQKDQPSVLGETLLHVAAKFGNVGVTDYALLTNIDTNARNSSGWTALHLAAKGGFIDVVEHLLVDERVDLDIESSKRRQVTALSLAVYSWSREESPGVKNTGATNNYIKLITALIDEGADVNSSDDSDNDRYNFGDTLPLHHALSPVYCVDAPSSGD